MVAFQSHPPLSPDLPAPRALAVHLVPGTRLVRGADLAAWQDAGQLVATARAQADAIVAGAEAARAAECQRGYDEGWRQARQEQAEQMIEHVGRTVDYLARVEGRMVELVMGAVRKIVAGFDDAERVLIVVRNALSVVRNQKQMALRLNPAQVEQVRAHVNELLASYPGVGYLDLVPDGRVQPDACILESEIGLVEASIEGQLEALRAAFGRILGSRA